MAIFGVGGGGKAARAPRARETVAQFGLDQLEQRVLLATVFWDGGAGTNSWHDKANWSNDTLPGSSDDVVISVQDNPTVTFSAGQTTVASMSSNESFTISGGTLSVTGGLSAAVGPFTVGGGTLAVGGTFGLTLTELRYNGGTISATPELVGGGLKFGGGTGAATFILGGFGTLGGNIGAGQTVWIRGSSSGANASITAAASFTNAGTIRLQSTDAEWDSILTLSSGTLTSTGTIEANLGSGGPRRIFGSLNNNGALNVQAGALLSLHLDEGSTFTHSGSAAIAGTLEATDGPVSVTAGTLNASGQFTVRNGSLTWNGGIIQGDVLVGASGLVLGANAKSAVSIVIHGSSTISGNIAAGQSVWVQGSDELGPAILKASASFTNAGLLRIESVDHEWESSVTLLNNAVLTNTGTIEANAGSGGPRSVNGKTVNNGVVAIQIGVTLFAGSLTQGAGGELSVEIEGTAPGEFGRLDASGAVVLAGEFKAEYLNGFVPVKFDSIQFLTGSISGEFDTVTLPFEDPDPDIKTLLVYSGNDVRLLITSTADMNNDGMLDLFDFLEFVNLFNAQDPGADFTGDGIFDLFDFLTFFNVFNK
jgi:hypothetical protein